MFDTLVFFIFSTSEIDIRHFDREGTVLSFPFLSLRRLFFYSCVFLGCSPFFLCSSAASCPVVQQWHEQLFFFFFPFFGFSSRICQRNMLLLSFFRFHSFLLLLGPDSIGPHRCRLSIVDVKNMNGKERQLAIIHSPMQGCSVCLLCAVWT